jgi:hypothetical protein
MADKNVKVELENPFIDKEWKGIKEDDVTEIVIDVGKDGKKVFDKIVHKIPRNRIFERYKALPDISVEIAKELIGENAYKDADADIRNLSYKEIRDKGLTFFMSTDAGLKRTGLLSLCPAILTGIKLYDIMPESEERNKLLSKIKSGIEACFRFIYRDQDWRNNSDLKPVFDASPYESDAFYPGDDKEKEGLNGRSYIDTISWAVFLFLRIMNFVDKNDKDKKFVFEEYRKEAKRLARWCLLYVNNAVLTIEAEDEEAEEEEKYYQRPVGWSFSKIVSSPKTAEAQSSLYFTYAAASMYLAFYDEYKDIIDYLMTINRKNDDKEIPFYNTLKQNYHVNNFKQAEEAIEAFEIGMEKEKPEQVKALEDLKEALEVLKKADPNDLEDYFYFNEGKSAEYNGKIYTVAEINDPKSLGPISRFKWNLEKISNDLWIKAKEKDKLENNFIYDDFNFNIATEEAIKSGGQTNALFAGLLHISICLYSTYDFVVSYTKDDGTGRFGPKAYEDMQNTMLLHVQKVQRFFDELEAEGKAFGVDSLTLRFSEDYSDDANKKGNLNDRELAERLRKQSIHIASLTPMLLKTNNLISRQIIKFPQKQMGTSLIRIGVKRFYDRTITSNNENEKYRWFWDSDGYHAMSNYYYVGAIFDFYGYYDVYEKQYIERYTEIRKTLEKDLGFSDTVREYYQKKEDEITELKTEHERVLKEKDKEIADIAAKAKKSEIGDTLVKNINQVVEDSTYFDDPEFLRRVIEGIRKQLAKEIKERYAKYPQPDNEVLAQLEEPAEPKDGTLFSLLKALAADIILPSAIEANKKPSGLIEELGRDGVEGDGVPVAKFALKGGKQLITDGVIDRLFALMFKTFNWKNPKKTEEM